MIRHGAPLPRRASVGKISAAIYRSIVDMDWSRIVSVIGSVGGSECTAPSSPFTPAGLSSEVTFHFHVGHLPDSKMRKDQQSTVHRRSLVTGRRWRLC